MQYTEIFVSCKNRKFHWINIDIFLIFAQNIDCVYTLEPPHISRTWLVSLGSRLRMQLVAHRTGPRGPRFDPVQDVCTYVLKIVAISCTELMLIVKI